MKREAALILILLVLLASISVLSQSTEEYDALVIFRNDDVSSADNKLQNFNTVFAEKDIPVTHSIVPKKIENTEDFNSTCRKLNEIENDDTNFAIHGYNHNGLEFKNSDWNNIEQKIEKINTFSESCLGKRSTVFVAPNNAMSSDARILLNESGFNVISADRTMAWQTGDSIIVEERSKFLEKRPLELGQSSMMVEDWNQDPVTFRNISELKEDFDKSINQNEIHVQTLHYKPIIRNNQTDELNNLINYMEQKKVYFTSFSELVEMFEEDNIRFNGEKWMIRR